MIGRNQFKIIKKNGFCFLENFLKSCWLRADENDHHWVGQCGKNDYFVQIASGRSGHHGTNSWIQCWDSQLWGAQVLGVGSRRSDRFKTILAMLLSRHKCCGIRGRFGRQRAFRILEVRIRYHAPGRWAQKRASFSPCKQDRLAWCHGLRWDLQGLSARHHLE